jgi:hypothetical protein
MKMKTLQQLQTQLQERAPWATDNWCAQYIAGIKPKHWRIWIDTGKAPEDVVDRMEYAIDAMGWINDKAPKLRKPGRG